jgi:hypothetical protein
MFQMIPMPATHVAALAATLGFTLMLQVPVDLDSLRAFTFVDEAMLVYWLG